MKSIVLKAAVLATASLAIGAMSSPAMSKTLTYTFGPQTGGGYCDGVTITNDGAGSVWTGNLIGCTDGAPVGGFTDISTTDEKDLPGWFLTYLLDTKALEWYLYTNYPLGTFAEINAGILTKGSPDIYNKSHAKRSVFKNPKAIDKPAF